MPIKGYGLWKGTLKAWDIKDARTDPKSPHGHIKFTDDSGRTLDCAINVKSSDIVTEVVYWKFRSPNFFDPSHPIITKLKGLTERRFYEADSASDSQLGLRIDLLRDGFIDLKAGHIPPWNTPGVPNDDIVDFLQDFVLNGVAKKAEVYIFGQRYPSKDGLHQVHMVQGSFFNAEHPGWEKENGVHQDGGIFLHFPDEDKWEAFFIAFASQASKTNDEGYPDTKETLAQHILGRHVIDDDDEVTTGSGVANARIHSALVNPEGPDNSPVREMIRVRNIGDVEIDLSGCIFENQSGARQVIAARSGGRPVVSAGGQAEFPAGDCYLPNNRDGRILLKDARGTVIDMVQYQKEQASRQGQWIVF
ncbi:hypothetical protein QBC34DRAFT_414596 [Podospora aff. communis PSN243]|uniref:LTD domain-containing protein n=1 Tax=Podospora aff. communis PSN243 TaxID=3040156 RepID=A0AAV9G9S7_9PEZI|nr:hypothetical protein QBC34DRAFT_414596 [Podospora aff. communis PSN243]